MAGAALGEVPAVAGMLGKASTALGEGALQTNLAARGLGTAGAQGALRTAGLSASKGLGNLATNLAAPAALGTGAAILGANLAPSIAGAVAPAVVAPFRAVGSTAAAMGAGRPGTPGTYNFTQGAVPGGLGEFGGTPIYGTSPWEVWNTLGPFAAQRTAEEMEGDVQVRNMQKMAAALAPYSEGAKKAEMMRQLAAAGIRSNIATQSAMLQQSQRAAQQMGINAAQQMGQALTSQYQYS